MFDARWGTPATDAAATDRPESTTLVTQSDGSTQTVEPTPNDGQTDAARGATVTQDPTGTPIQTGAPDPTETPLPTVTPMERQTPGDGQSLPPGVHADGTVNETRVLVAHLEAANESGWRLRHRNGNDTSVLVHADGTSYERRSDGVTWYRDGVTVTNRTYFGPAYRMSARHDTTTGLDDPTGAITFALAVRLSTGTYRWAGTTDADGRTLHELRMTGAQSGGSTLGHYTGRLLVDDDGRIHHLAGEVGENESVADGYEYDYEWGVETVPRPEWFDTVPRGVTEKTADGTALNVR